VLLTRTFRLTADGGAYLSSTLALQAGRVREMLTLKNMFFMKARWVNALGI
jgi:hypothetical protein